uniref:Uncharacterized protein n=1 Tax=Caenorhabditis tropicalis TaxID=1561998 RepID=A0A1I7TUN7_9PELO
MSCESHLKLKYLEITIPSPDAMNEIMDLPHEVTTHPKMIETFAGHPFFVDVTQGFKIKRNDGKMATACAAPLWNGWRLCLLVH